MREILRYINLRYLNNKGQGIVEYALILVFVVAIAAAVLTTDTNSGIGQALQTAFNKVITALGGTPTGGGAGAGTTPTTPTTP